MRKALQASLPTPNPDYIERSVAAADIRMTHFHRLTLNQFDVYFHQAERFLPS